MRISLSISDDLHEYLESIARDAGCPVSHVAHNFLVSGIAAEGNRLGLLSDATQRVMHKLIEHEANALDASTPIWSSTLAIAAGVEPRQLGGILGQLARWGWVELAKVRASGGGWVTTARLTPEGRMQAYLLDRTLKLLAVQADADSASTEELEAASDILDGLTGGESS
jgi:hypothetical protein